MKFPYSFYFLCFYLLGILYARYNSQSIFLILLVLVISFLALRRLKIFLLIICVFLFFLGCFLYKITFPKYLLYEKDVKQIKGVIEDIYVNGNYVQYIIRSQDYNEKFIINCRQELFNINDFVLVEDVDLYPLNFANNYLFWDENILYKVNASNMILLRKNEQFSIRTLKTMVKSKLELIFSHFDENKRNFLKAIIIGEKRQLGEYIKNLFVETGTAHLLAISGLHVSFLIMILGTLLPFRKVLTNIFLLPFLLFYGWLLGDNPPVWRVIGQYVFMMIAFLLRKEEDPLNAIFWVALLNLLVSPLKLFNVSFQFSYMAMLGLLYKPKFKKFLPKYFQDIWESSCWLSFCLLPLNFYYFGKIQIVSVIANFYAIPIFSMVLLLAFFFIIFSFLPFGFVLENFLSLTIDLLLKGLHLIVYQYKISLLISIFLIFLPIFIEKRGEDELLGI